MPAHTDTFRSVGFILESICFCFFSRQLDFIKLQLYEHSGDLRVPQEPYFVQIIGLRPAEKRHAMAPVQESREGRESPENAAGPRPGPAPAPAPAPHHAPADSNQLAVGAAGAGGTGTLKRTTCDSCRERKVRCDRTKPECLRCRRSGIVCTYPSSDADAAKIHQALHSLSKRLGKSQHGATGPPTKCLEPHPC